MKKKHDFLTQMKWNDVVKHIINVYEYLNSKFNGLEWIIIIRFKLAI